MPSDPDERLTVIPAWASWLAQDLDGTWWAFEHEPNLGTISWYENEVGRSKRIASGEPNSHWGGTLRKTSA